jgi:hypothetical protein
MKKIEWPGIATAAALICAGTIIFAIWRDPDGFRLKDWQTFMAACVALVGGTMAYRGAMAKVDLDREVHQSKVDREELGTYLRLRSTLTFVAQFAQSKADKIKAFRLGLGTDSISAADMHPRMVFSVDEAWKNLDMFEADVSKDIAEIKSLLDAFYIAVNEFGDAVWRKTSPINIPEEAIQLEVLLKRIVQLSRSISSGVSRDIGNY